MLSIFDVINSFDSTDAYSYLKSTDNGYTLDVDLPGITKEEVKVEAIGNRLIVRAKGKVRKYEKTYLLPITVTSDSVNGKLENGILSLDITNSSKTRGNLVKIN